MIKEKLCILLLGLRGNGNYIKKVVLFYCMDK